jgi:putative ABC transport system permease protein
VVEDSAMNEVFGLRTTSIMQVLIVIFACCIATGVWILLRNRVVFKLGIRNLPRRPSQTILIIVGLMLSTLIIAAAFTTGDTLNYSIKGETLDLLGPSDEFVVLSTDSEGEALGATEGAQIPESIAAKVETALAGNPNVDGVMPILSKSVPAINRRSGLSEPALLMTGLEPEGVSTFGGLTDLNGNPIDLTALSSSEIVLGESAADKLDAVAGDSLFVYVNNLQHQLLVAAIASDSPLTGMVAPGTSGGFAMPLLRVQTLLEEPSALSYIAVSNRGGIEDGVKHTDSVMATLNGALDGTPYQAIPIKRDSIDTAEQAANGFLGMFLVMGMFSISVGILLIFLIFVMLAAERKPEMGMARAVGMKRRQLIQAFVAEGMAYDLVAALLGAALGVGVAFVMVLMLAGMFGDTIDIRPRTSWPSLVIAYTLGVIVTFITILISSWRISRLNISEAVRNTPEAPRVREGRSRLVLGFVTIVAGGLLIWAGMASDSAGAFYFGLSIIPLGLVAVLRRFGVSPRLLYSTTSIYLLLLWLLPDSIASRIMPELGGGWEMFFVSGIMLVTAATMLIIWNANVVTSGAGLLGRAFSRWLPAIRTAVAYPLERKGRTGMTIAMFSLVVFSLVMMAAITDNIVEIFSGESASGGWDVIGTQAPTNQIGDFRLTAADEGLDVSAIEATGQVTTMPLYLTQVRVAGDSDWGTYTVNGMDAGFMAESDIELQTRASGYATDADVWRALATTPDLAIVDPNVIPFEGLTFATSPFTIDGVKATDDTMNPIQIEIADPASGKTRTVTLIGIIDSKAFTFSGVFITEATFETIFPAPNSISHYLRLAPGADAEAAAKTFEAGLINYGVQADSIGAIVDELMSEQNSFMRLFEGFMALGLVVGIAALGVIAFRSVVERRQQIGMLRSIGYRRSMVAASFMLESSMISIIGTLSGTLLGLALAYNLMTSDYFVSNSDQGFVVPWVDLVAVIGLTLIASLLMAYVPARRASGVSIAEALRYE